MSEYQFLVVCLRTMKLMTLCEVVLVAKPVVSIRGTPFARLSLGITACASVRITMHQ